MLNVLASPYRNLVPLFTDAAWTTLTGVWTPSADGLSASGTQTGGVSVKHCVPITVKPFTTYEVDVTTNGKYGVTDSTGMTFLLAYAGQGKRTFNTGRYTSILVYLATDGLPDGMYSWSNAYLRAVQPAFDPAKVPPPYFKELVTNGDFSQGATGWTLHANASVQGGKVVLNATAGSQSSSTAVNIPVTPNTMYELHWDAGGYVTGLVLPWMRVTPYSGNTPLTAADSIPTGNGRTIFHFSTPPNATSIRLFLSNSGTGTFTFDNISLRRKAP